MAKKKGKSKQRSTQLLKTVKGPFKFQMHSFLGDIQGCGTIRVIYPCLLLNHLRMDKKKIGFYASYGSYYIQDTEFYKKLSLIQFQRSATKAHLEIFTKFSNTIKKQTNTPIVYEIDDLLIGIPEWNYASEYYSQLVPYVEKMMGMADGMVCSTEKLREVYSKYNKNISVIPNHLPKFIWGDIYPKHQYEPREKRPKILWAGSQNHFTQKHMYEKGIKGGDFSSKLLDFIRKTTDKYQWVFSGGLPIELNGIKNKLEVHPWINVFNYAKHVKDIDADFWVVPLESGLFNDCKSNIKMLEISACGCPAVYSVAEPYKNAAMKAETDDYMIDCIERLASNIDLRKKTFEHDYNAVKPLLWWEENGNIKKYVNSYLRLFNKKLP